MRACPLVSARRRRTWDSKSTRLAAAVALLCLIGLLLSTGRWGSYLGVPSWGLFITDAVLAGVAALVLLRPGGIREVVELRSRWPRGTWLLLVGLVGWALVRLVVGGLPTRDALRDFAPYLYIVIGLLAAVQPPEPVVRRVVVVAATVHSAWLTYVLTDQSWAATMPALGRTRLFEIRTDFDATVCGVALVVCSYMAVRTSSRAAGVGLVALAVWQVLLVLSMNSRAGLLGSLLPTLIFGGAYLARQLRGSPRARVAALTASLILIVVMGVAFLYSPPAQRLVGGFSDRSSAGAGTVNARVEAYQRVTNYLVESPGRTFVGVGFGPDFMAAAEADTLYEGNVFRGVRAPHNFFLNTWARLGIVAAVVQLGLVAVGVVLALRVALVGRQPVVSVLAGALALSLPLAAAVGVIFESPFGAVPYSWALGVLAVAAPRSGTYRREPTP